MNYNKIIKTAGFIEDSYGNLKRLIYSIDNLVKHGCLFTTILEIGCGTGQNISLPLSRYGLDVKGIDIDMNSIRYANNLRKINNLHNIEFLNIDIRDIENESFKAIICSEVLEHLDKPHLMVKEISRVLKHGGIAILTVPNGYGPYEIMQYLSKKYRAFIKVKLIEYGIHKYLKRIGRSMEKNGDVFGFNPGGTLNIDCDHIQYFRVSSLRKIFNDEALEIINITGRTFLCGRMLTPIIEHSQKLIELNTKLASYLPLSCCSDWMFTVKKI